MRNVVPDSPAWRAGITFADEIVAVDGARVTPASFAKRIGDRDPGDRCAITYFRRDQLETATLTLGENPDRRLVLRLDPAAGKAALAIRRGWLGV